MFFLRQVFGIFALFAYLALYTIIAMWIGLAIEHWPFWALTIYYMIAGIAWTIPARYLLRIIR